MHVEFLTEEREGLAASDRDEPQATSLRGAGFRFTIVCGGFAGEGAVGDERDPPAVRAPARVLLAA
jgi:hypothetical protein